MREAKGTLEAETELARRERELADVQSTLSLLEAGLRPEEVEAERARLARLQEESRYLELLQDRLPIHSPVPGLIMTPQLKEKAGQYVREGELICVVEEPAGLEVEITLAEQDVTRVRPGQAVDLRARAAPFTTLRAEVSRVAPAACRGDTESTVIVYGRLNERSSDLRPDDRLRSRLHLAAPAGNDPCGPSAALATNRTLVVVASRAASRYNFVNS